MFLSNLILLLLLSNIINANNNTGDFIPTLEELYPLPINEQLSLIASQFRQNPIWELGNMPLLLTEAQQMTPITCICCARESRYGHGITYKNGHLFAPDFLNPYHINPTRVHPRTTHHIFLVRHGLYFYTEDESTSHLLRYGKYQARMAGHKINKKIHELIQTIGPLTRPIKLVSSTQTRAFETLFNIRLQLSNNLVFEPEIIQDSGLRECVEANKQRRRWLYFVREYLQPPQTDRPEHTVTIIAGHGNLFTAFDYIIQTYFSRRRPADAFATFHLPSTPALSHGQTTLYRTVGLEIPKLVETFIMNEIPVTVNHAHLSKDIYYEWAAMHKCRAIHAHDEMKNYIHAGVIDNVFAKDQFQNRIRNYNIIVYFELKLEFATHFLPMIQHNCRRYLYRLSLIQANTDFGSFSQLGSPIPIPATEAEQKALIPRPMYKFSPYSMPFRVENTIQKFRENPILNRGPFVRTDVHPESRNLLFLIRHDKYLLIKVIKEYFVFFYILRLNVNTGDDKANYLTRLGINQIQGIMSQIHKHILNVMVKLPGNTRLYPFNIVSDPTIESAESCYHARSFLIGLNYTVPEQITDLGLLYNYYEKKSRSEFFDFQRVQILYMLRSYLAADTSSSTIPSLRVHILCGEGRLFTAFRQEMSLGGLLAQPHESFSIIMDPELNVLNHGESLYFEAIGPDIIRLHDSLSLLRSANIPEEQRLPTSDSLQLTSRDLKYWIRNRLSPCSLTYFMAHKERLSLSVLYSGPLFHKRIARLLRQEWYPYLAGLFVYSCRVQLTLLNGGNKCEQHTVSPTAASASASVLNETIDRF